MKKNILNIAMASMLLGLAACDNQNNEFDDFDYQTVYFANQYATRTVELGEDEFVDNSMDNEHKIKIKAIWGGGYDNRRNVIIDYKVDESLCENLYFKGTNIPVLPMPSSHYKLASKQINIPKGSISDGVEVELTDAFFADEKSLSNNYVIPIVMTDVQGADSILEGKSTIASPRLTKADDWSFQPKNFVLYCVKFVNPWHGEYLRRGVDQATLAGTSKTIVRHAEHVEKDEVVGISTNGYRKNILSLTAKDENGVSFGYELLLTFDEEGNCTISDESDDIQASGSGKFVIDGEKKSLGGKDRNALYLDYTVDFGNRNIKYATKDTLVLRTRNVYGAGTFDVELK